MQCPKCNYVRQPGDQAPETECPKCGVIYAKAIAALQRPAQAAPARPSVAAAPVQPSDPSLDPATAAPVPPRPAPTPKPLAPPPTEAAPEPMEVSNLSGLLQECLACASPISMRASACPRCGHPNPDAPNTNGQIAGVIALALAIGSIFMPYVAAIFLAPAAIAGAAVGFLLRATWVPAMALMLGFGGLFNVYHTSKKIQEIGQEATRQQSELRRSMDALNRSDR